ncbi:hypothetical protein [Salinisphaera sp. G21_0]|uniref:hypothetical protein n=1 Tax=Salinisphaera sp. G21_0 TaxID=2821094 RepID=UPI001AD951D3|nr:hypothetical protein [Salinisphaera sp. G21_0]MBO9482270.1 hypothetical protein [Salinisphaera sp. G21_0]
MKTKNQLMFIARDLEGHTNPAQGIAELLFDCLSNMEASEDGSRLALAELVNLADSLRAHCRATSLYTGELKDKIEEVRA